MRLGDNATRGWAPKQSSQVLPRLSSQQLGKPQKTKSLRSGEPSAAPIALGTEEDELPDLSHKHASGGVTAISELHTKASSRGNMLVAEPSSALPALTLPNRGVAGIPALHTFLAAQAEDTQRESVPAQGSLTAESRLKSLPNYAKPQNRAPIWSERDRRARNVTPANPYKQKLDLAATLKIPSESGSQRISTNTSVEVSPGRFRVAPLGLSKQPTEQRSDLAHLDPLGIPGKLSKASFHSIHSCVDP